ncbi:MAG: ferritin family protein [candidate division Zixibacteria bacterium]|nr:ferritin family protein [candidate division Zixibacteria bacterium]
MTPVSPQILDALTAGIKSEVAAYAFYTEAARKLTSADIKQTLQKLALEEKDHFHVLERQYDSLVRSERWISTADILKQPGLPDISEDMTSQHRVLIEEVRKATSTHDVLKIAYRLEEEAYELFAGEAERATAPEARAIFDKLSRFEETHMILIRELMRKYPPD